MKYFCHYFFVIAIALFIPILTHASDQNAAAESSWASLAAPVIWARAIERILIILICGCCIGFGFFLFKKASSDAGTMLARGQGFELKLTRIGPGVLFCLFGVSGLIYTIHSQPTLAIKNAPNGTNASDVFDYRGAINSGNIEAKQILIARLEALNLAIERLNAIQAQEGTNKSTGYAISVLVAWREDLIGQAIGNEKLGKFLLAEKNKINVKPESDPNLRAIYEEMDALRAKVTRQE